MIIAFPAEVLCAAPPANRVSPADPFATRDA